MLRQFAWVITTLLLFSLTSQAASFKVYKENDDKRAVLKNNRPLTIYYEKIAWDENITQVEAGYLFLRDRTSGEIYEIQLTETEPNSSVFSKRIEAKSFNSDKLEAEVYSVPKEMLKGQNRLNVLKKLIADKALKRKPFLLRVLRQKGQIIDVFDDKKDALAAYNKYKKMLGISAADKDDIKPSDSIIEVSKQQKPVKKRIIDTSTLQSMFLANKSGLENEAAKNQETRDVLRKIEEKRRRTVKNNGKAWDKATAAKNEKLAKELAAQGYKFRSEKKHDWEQKKLLESSDKIPVSEYIYQQYGIALYNNGKHNQSIVVLEITKPAKNRIAENYYFQGMNYYKLEDYENAAKMFKKSMDMNDKKMSPTAAFYHGLTLQKLEKFDEANKSFQYVLDKSDNPNLDRRADQLIELGVKKKALAEKRSHRWFYDGVLGLFYDSNIVLALDGQANTNTDKEGLRFLLSNRLKYRALYKENHELGIRASATLLQSRTTGLEQSNDLEVTDPWVVSLDVPWTYRGTLWKKGYTFDLAPKYEMIYMDLDNTSKQAIIKSMGVTMNNKLVINSNWIAIANYEIRKDDADPSTGTISNDADAFKLVADFSSIIVLNKDDQRFLIPHLSYTRNDANGADFGYTRVDISATFTNSLFDMFVWTNKVGFFVANYESIRNDKNYSLTSGLSYSINAHWSAGLNMGYQKNDSNTNPYSKYQIISTFSFSY